jgi:hypothetical protein
MAIYMPEYKSYMDTQVVVLWVKGKYGGMTVEPHGRT